MFRIVKLTLLFVLIVDLLAQEFVGESDDSTIHLPARNAEGKSMSTLSINWN